MSEIQLKATSVEDKPVRIGDLPIIKTNILENARQMDKGVVGGYNGAFPLTAASEGGIYLLPSTGKFYVCETAYNGAQISAPNSNFVELSVWKNHDRLAKLSRIVTTSKIIGDLQDAEVGSTITFSEKLSSGDIIMVYSGFSTQNNYVTSIGIVTVSIPFVIPTYKGNIVLEVTGEKTCKILKASDSIRAIYKTIVV